MAKTPDRDSGDRQFKSALPPHILINNMSYFCFKCKREFTTKSGCTQHVSRCHNVTSDSYLEIVEKYLKGMSINDIQQDLNITRKVVMYALRNTKKRITSESQKCSHASSKRKRIVVAKFPRLSLSKTNQCECGKIFNLGNLVRHKRSCIKHITKNQPNVITDIENKWKSGIKRNELNKLYSKKLVQAVLKNKRQKRKAFSEQVRQKISQSRLKYLNEHPETLPYRLYHSSKKSYVEELFKKALIENNIHGWESRYRVGIYEYDIAFIKERIDVEIDGKTHELEIVKNKDKKRDDWSRQNGWKVIRFTASEVKNKLPDCLLVLKDFLEFAESSNGKILGS